jgi:RND family efflux transporter MFP subunit
MKKIFLFRAPKEHRGYSERSELLGERSRHRLICLANHGSVPGSARLVNNIIIALIITLVLSACAAASKQPTAIPTISLDNNNSSSDTQSSDANSVSAKATIVPVRKAELAFANVGRVKAVNVKVGDQVTAGQALVELDTTLLEVKVKEAQANLTAAQVQVDYLKRVGTDELHLETAQAAVDQAQALLDSANATLATQSKLVAPFDGTVASVDISPAETVVPGTEVIIMGDFSRLQVETTDLSERDVPRVQIGQTASVFIKALNQEFPGRVIDISRISSTLGGDVVFKVTIDLDEQPQGLLWGMSADVKIQTGK